MASDDPAEFPLEPNFSDDCFWAAVAEIETQHKSKKASQQNASSSKKHPNFTVNISRNCNNSHTNVALKPTIRARTNSSSSSHSNTSSSSSQLSQSSKRKPFKHPPSKSKKRKRDALMDQKDNDQSQWKFVWKWPENDGSWHNYDGASQTLLEQMQIGAHIQITAGKWTYDIVKNAADQCTQTNTSTNASRACRRFHCICTARSNNPNYQAAAAQLSRPDRKRQRIIELDPDDVQEIIIADDLRQLNRDDQNDAQLQKSYVQFGDGEHGDDDDDNKSTHDDNQPERVTMTDEDKAVLTEFHKTMTSDSVQVLSVRKIKDNASKSIVYNALLTAKQEELKNVAQIERVLFHGTSAANVAKIVNSGFNRDFNRHHLYGRGTYFSSLASESAKYCENDDSNKDGDDNADNGKFVMLVCRVIVGEFVQGTRKMDGASMPYKPDKKTQFESLVNHVQRPTIFVINRDYHAIPTHIITFKYRN